MELKGTNLIKNFIKEKSPYLIVSDNNSTGLEKYLWTNYKSLSEMIKKNKIQVYFYSLMEFDNEFELIKGYKYLNRVGYFCSIKNFDLNV